jgi:hypothetical protein
MHTIATLTLVNFFLLSFLGCSFSDAYPLVMELPSKEDTCFRFTLPDDDDAHMLFAALPDGVDEKVTTWLVSEMKKATDNDSHTLNALPSPPADIQTLIDSSSVSIPGKSDVFFKVQLAGGSKRIIKNNMIPFFKYESFEHIAGGLDGPGDRGQHKDWNADKGTYNVCFQNYHRGIVHGIFEVVTLSTIEEKHRRKKMLKKEHFAPLEEIYEQSLELGETILDEMIHMEAREHLMQRKSDTAGNKVRMFSVFSICVLVGVTWLQVTYLKNYFRKKKVL